eukprot:scaffold664763_cov65-Prasinocladus_malaysianus.AAC.1
MNKSRCHSYSKLWVLPVAEPARPKRKDQRINQVKTSVVGVNHSLLGELEKSWCNNLFSVSDG